MDAGLLDFLLPSSDARDVCRCVVKRSVCRMRGFGARIGQAVVDERPECGAWFKLNWCCPASGWHIQATAGLSCRTARLGVCVSARLQGDFDVSLSGPIRARVRFDVWFTLAVAGDDSLGRRHVR